MGKGAFGEVYEVLWTGLGTDWGAVMAMKTVRLADLSSDKRDEVRVLLMEEILTVSVTAMSLVPRAGSGTVGWMVTNAAKKKPMRSVRICF